MSNEPLRAGFPTWAAPGIGALLGGFFGFMPLLQSEPVSPWPPLVTIGAGAALGLVAGIVLVLWEKLRKE